MPVRRETPPRPVMTQRHQQRPVRRETAANLHTSQPPPGPDAAHQATATKTPAHGRSPVRHAARVHPTGSRIDGLNAILTTHRQPEPKARQVPIAAGRSAVRGRAGGPKLSPFSVPLGCHKSWAVANVKTG